MNRQVKQFGTNGAHITLPKDWIGKMVTVEIVEQPKQIPDYNKELELLVNS